MQIKPTPISGLYVIELAAREDERGYFMRTYDREIFRQQGLQTEWVQENQSKSVLEHTIRGLHFQRPPHSETKLVRALSGSFFDVAVDLRLRSPTYGKSFGLELSESNRRCLYIPKGFAHGFCTLAPNTIVAYKVDQFYAPNAEGGLLWNDPSLTIDWPLETKPSIISKKDCEWPCLDQLQPMDLDRGDA